MDQWQIQKAFREELAKSSHGARVEGAQIALDAAADILAEWAEKMKNDGDPFDLTSDPAIKKIRAQEKAWAWSHAADMIRHLKPQTPAEGAA